MNSANFGGYNLSRFRQESGRKYDNGKQSPYDVRANLYNSNPGTPIPFGDGHIISGEGQLGSLFKNPILNTDDNNRIDPELAGFNNRIDPELAGFNNHISKFEVINKERDEIFEQRQLDRSSGTSSIMKKNEIRKIWTRRGYVKRKLKKVHLR